VGGHGGAQGGGQGQERQGGSAAPLADLGKGLPLHAVPPEWPLYIVEFKAGRTDLFYRAADRMVSGFFLCFVFCFGGGAFLLLLLCYDFICDVCWC
jgi:hypothetical protein